jgi:hypothetical protein
MMKTISTTDVVYDDDENENYAVLTPPPGAWTGPARDQE